MGGAEVIATSPARSRRDDTHRIGAIVPLQKSNRIAAKRLLEAMGWDTGSLPVAQVRVKTGDRALRGAVCPRRRTQAVRRVSDRPTTRIRAAVAFAD